MTPSAEDAVSSGPELTDDLLRALREQFRGRDQEMYDLVVLCGWGDEARPGDLAWTARERLREALARVTGGR